MTALAHSNTRMTFVNITAWRERQSARAKFERVYRKIETQSLQFAIRKHCYRARWKLIFPKEKKKATVKKRKRFRACCFSVIARLSIDRLLKTQRPRAIWKRNLSTALHRTSRDPRVENPFRFKFANEIYCDSQRTASERLYELRRHMVILLSRCPNKRYRVFGAARTFRRDIYQQKYA